MKSLAILICLVLWNADCEKVFKPLESAERTEASYETAKNPYEYEGYPVDFFSMIPKDVVFSELQAMPLDEILDKDTPSGFVPEVDELLWQIKEEVCPESDTCTHKAYLGCACMSWFQKEAAQCPDLPCEAFRLVYKGGPTFLRSLVKVNTFEEIVRLVVDQVVEPVMELLCRCTADFVDGGIYCTVNYDADLLVADADPGAKDMWQGMMSMLDFNALKRVLMPVLNAMCEVKAKKPCYKSFEGMVIKAAKMLDNSFDEQHSNECSAFNRLDDVLTKYMILFGTMSQSDDDSAEEIVEKILAGEREILEEFLCDKSCGKYVSKNFYDCCAKSLSGVVDKRLIKDIAKFASSILTMAQGEMIKLKFSQKAQNDFIAMMNPVKMCKDVPFYRKASRSCKN